MLSSHTDTFRLARARFSVECGRPPEKELCIRKPAHFFFVKKQQNGKWLITMQPILVLNRRFGNIVLIIVVMGKRAILRTYSASSVTISLLKCPQPVLERRAWFGGAEFSFPSSYIKNLTKDGRNGG